MEKELDNKKLWESLIKNRSGLDGIIVNDIVNALNDQGFTFDSEGRIVPIETEVNAVSGQNENQIGGQIGGQKPKFKEGDWVVAANGIAAQILDLQRRCYVGFYVDGKDFISPYSEEDTLRQWTIAEAKDGDVLATLDYILIFKERLKDNGGVSHCLYDFTAFTPCFNWNEDRNWYFGKEAIIHPATKEQRDTLMKAMDDAGYTFDFEKRELKKIEQKSTEEYNPYKEVVESIAEMCKRCDNMDVGSLQDFYDNVKVKCKDAKEYDSLYPQSTWKPSDEQMKLLREVQQALLGKDCHNRFVNFMHELKKLREE